MFISVGVDSVDNLFDKKLQAGDLVLTNSSSKLSIDMFLAHILSNTSQDVLHFLTEYGYPKYIKVEKENYTYISERKPEIIKDIIFKFWDNGFRGIIAIDNLSFLDFGAAHNSFSLYLHNWLSFLVDRSNKKQSQLQKNNSCLFVNNPLAPLDKHDDRHDDIFTKSSIPAKLKYSSSYIIEIRLLNNQINCQLTKSRTSSVQGKLVTFDIDKSGIVS